MTSFAPANLLFGLSALAAMLPATVLGLRHGQARGTVFWAVIAVSADIPYTPSAAKVFRSA